LWQWVHHPEAKLEDGRRITPALYLQLAEDESAKLGGEGKFILARQILDDLVLSDEFKEFLTIEAYEYL
jgi:malate synthase